MSIHIFLFTALLFVGCQSIQQNTTSSPATKSAGMTSTINAVVKSYCILIPASDRRSKDLRYQSILEVVTPAEQQGIEVWIESSWPLHERHVLRKNGHVQFQVSDFTSHRSGYMKDDKWHEVYIYRMDELQEFKSEQVTDLTPNQRTTLLSPVEIPEDRDLYLLEVIAKAGVRSPLGTVTIQRYDQGKMIRSGKIDIKKIRPFDYRIESGNIVAIDLSLFDPAN